MTRRIERQEDGMDGAHYLTAQEAAARLKLTVPTVRRWLAEGRLRGRRLSRRAGWRIEAGEVERLLAAPAPDATSGEAGR